MQQTTSEPSATTPAPAGLVGRVRRFGPHGVPYEVISVVSADEVRIRVITTGEEATYAVADVLTDPED